MPPIHSLHVNADFSAESVEKRWSALITRTDGSTAFVLSLEPDFDTANNVVGLALVLHRPGARADDTNLLAPIGIWHGLQPYEFAAEDLAKGVNASVFGPKRVVVLKSLGLVVETNVVKAVATQVSPDHHGLESLNLQINVTPSKK